MRKGGGTLCGLGWQSKFRSFSFGGHRSRSGRRGRQGARSGSVKLRGLTKQAPVRYLRALLPELPQADAERLIRYYWRDDIDGTAATERIDDKIKHRITMAIYRTQYNGACCEQLEESYLKGAVYALAETVNRCGPLLDEDYLQRAADRLELPLENLKKRLDAVMKEFFSE